MKRLNSCVLIAVILYLFPLLLEAGEVILPKTGQTLCYNAGGRVINCIGTKQDGDFQAGMGWPEPRFTDNNDGTITDHLTGLIWLKNANCFGNSTWLDALDSCKNLSSGSCGLSDGSKAGDWRLPNITELESLVNSGVSNQSFWLLDNGFSNVQNAAYWSSTTYQLSSYPWSYAMNVDMSNGVVYIDSKSEPWINYEFEHVWAVRNGPPGVAGSWRTGQISCYDGDGDVIDCTDTGQDGDLKKGTDWPSPRFTNNLDGNNLDGTVTDNLTGLIWLRDASCLLSEYAWEFDTDGNIGDGRVSWQKAFDFVDGVNNGTYSKCSRGYSDWRLPNRKELLSLIDHGTHEDLYLQNHPFVNVQSELYWSSTTVAIEPEKAWVIDMGAGISLTIFQDKSENGIFAGNIWLVRDGHLLSEDGYPELISGDLSLTIWSVNPDNPIEVTYEVNNPSNQNQEVVLGVEIDGELRRSETMTLVPGQNNLKFSTRIPTDLHTGSSEVVLLLFSPTAIVEYDRLVMNEKLNVIVPNTLPIFKGSSTPGGTIRWMFSPGETVNLAIFQGFFEEDIKDEIRLNLKVYLSEHGDPSTKLMVHNTPTFILSPGNNTYEQSFSWIINTDVVPGTQYDILVELYYADNDQKILLKSEWKRAFGVIATADGNMKRFALLVGNGYSLKDKLLGDGKCENNDEKIVKADIEAVKNVLQNHGFEWSNGQAFFVELEEENVKTNNIAEEIRKIGLKMDKDDILFFWYSGHGTETGLTTYQCKSKYSPLQMSTNINRFLPDGSIFVAFLMACHSGVFVDEFMKKPVRPNTFIMSSSESEKNTVGDSWIQSILDRRTPFAQYFCESIEGSANTDEGSVVTFDEIFAYMSPKMIDAGESGWWGTRTYNHPQRTPVDGLGNIPIVTGADLNSIPWLQMSTPAQNIEIASGGTVEIQWMDDDDYPNAFISLAYDQDTSPMPWVGDKGHTWIKILIPEKDTIDSLTWSTSGVLPGTYSVWAMIYDGALRHVERFSKAAGNVTILPTINNNIFQNYLSNLSNKTLQGTQHIIPGIGNFSFNGLAELATYQGMTGIQIGEVVIDLSNSASVIDVLVANLSNDTEIMAYDANGNLIVSIDKFDDDLRYYRMQAETPITRFVVGSSLCWIGDVRITKSETPRTVSINSIIMLLLGE